MLRITSSASPVGSSIFAIFALLIVSVVVLLILRHYLPLRTTPAFYLLPIFFALWLPSIVILLVPIDLASTAATRDDKLRGIWLPERVILVSWRISYWLTFALTWYTPFFAPWPRWLLIWVQVHSSNSGRVLRRRISRTERQAQILPAIECAVPCDGFEHRIRRPHLLLHQIRI